MKRWTVTLCVLADVLAQPRGPNILYIYDPGLRFPTPPPPPPNVMTLSTLPIAPMTMWRPPCCFEGELAEIENRITSGHVWSLEYLFMP